MLNALIDGEGGGSREREVKKKKEILSVLKTKRNWNVEPCLILTPMGGGVLKTQIAFDALLDPLGVKIEC